MYHQYFGLSESPFSISVNPRYLFMSPRHRDALAHLLYGVGSGGGFILLTGEVGTGKTTINRCLLEQMPETTDLAIVLNPALSAVELLATVCDELQIDYPQGTNSLKQLTDALHRFLLDNHAAGRKTVLMIDEAQHLDFDVLEQIRLLTNLETDDEKLLQIILIGQPELTEKLHRPELRQLNQRITARYDLQPLSVDETRAYIRHRLEVAGLSGSRELFPASVVREIHRRTRGIPRQINLLCDRTLLGAYGRQQSRVSRGLVRSAAAEVFGDSQQSGKLRGWLVGAGMVTIAAVAVVLVLMLGREDSVSDPNPQSSASQLSSDSPVSPNKQSSADATPWLLSDERATSLLWQLSSDAPAPAVSCPDITLSGLRCTAGETRVWEPIINVGRPVLLQMETPDRFSASTVVVAFEARSAWVMTEVGLELVPLVELARSWGGGFRYWWQAPAGWQRPLAEGDTGAGVESIAKLFAQLDQQERTLAATTFNAPLAARVKLFQRAHALKADGVVGEQTLMRLNEVLDVALAPEQALRRARVLTGGR